MVTEEKSMASETRHAAWQTERRFAVRLLPEGGPPTELAGGLTEFLDAFDLAFEWLHREDPARTGRATLTILETCDGVSEEVWTYPPAPANGQELVARLGFNPLNWPGVPGYSADERKSRLRQRVGATDRRADEAPSPKVEHVVAAAPAPSVAPSVAHHVVLPEPEPEPKPTLPDHVTAPVEATERAPVRERVRRWIRANARPTWNDRVSRVCLVLSGASLWFSLGLADPQFLVPLLVFVPTLWWRHRNREAPAPEAETEDWL
jgi:hypothetical protein